MRRKIATILCAAVALAACSKPGMAATSEWRCVAPPNYSRHISDVTAGGPDYSVSGRLDVDSTNSSSSEWDPSASAIIFRRDKERMVALRLVSSSDQHGSGFDVVFAKKSGKGVINTIIATLSSGASLEFNLQLAADGNVKAVVNGHIFTDKVEPIQQATVQLACSGGSFRFTDFGFPPV